MFQKKLVGIFLSCVMLLSFSWATQSRINTLGGLGLLKDDTDIFVFPSEIVLYKNIAIFDQFIGGSRLTTIKSFHCFNSIVTGCSYSIPNNVFIPDLFIAMKLGNPISLGLHLNRIRTINEKTNDQLVENDSKNNTSNTDIDLGASFLMGNIDIQAALSLGLQNMNIENSIKNANNKIITTTKTYQSGLSPIEINIRAGLVSCPFLKKYCSSSENDYSKSCGILLHFETTNMGIVTKEEDKADVKINDTASKLSLSFLKLVRLNEKILLVGKCGFGQDTREQENNAKANTQTTTNMFFPDVSMGIEVLLPKNFTLRNCVNFKSGVRKVETDIVDVGANDTTTENGNIANCTFELGLGYKLGNLQIDMTVDKDVLNKGLYFLHGIPGQGNLFPLVSLSYIF